EKDHFEKADSTVEPFWLQYMKLRMAAKEFVANEHVFATLFSRSDDLSVLLFGFETALDMEAPNKILDSFYDKLVSFGRDFSVFKIQSLKPSLLFHQYHLQKKTSVDLLPKFLTLHTIFFLMQRLNGTEDELPILEKLKIYLVFSWDYYISSRKFKEGYDD